jgi:tape measure domain-containing protein
MADSTRRVWARLSLDDAARVKAGDALTRSLFRLQTATGSVERAGAVSESVDALQRFSIAAREIGATSDQVVRLAAGLHRVAIVSGASNAEIGSGTPQLAQALASGVLQGDELRSVLEAMPRLAERLVRELGVSSGQLRQLGSAGKLTAERVFPAQLRAAERVGAKLGKAPLSLGRAFGQLMVATEGVLGQLDRAIGLSNTLARALSGAARAMDGVRQGTSLLTDTERLAEQRRQLQALADQISRLEAEADGPPRACAPSRAAASSARAWSAPRSSRPAWIRRSGWRSCASTILLSSGM